MNPTKYHKFSAIAVAVHSKLPAALQKGDSGNADLDLIAAQAIMYAWNLLQVKEDSITEDDVFALAITKGKYLLKDQQKAEKTERGRRSVRCKACSTIPCDEPNGEVATEYDLHVLHESFRRYEAAQTAEAASERLADIRRRLPHFVRKERDRKIFWARAEGIPASEVAARFGLTATNVNKIYCQVRQTVRFSFAA